MKRLSAIAPLLTLALAGAAAPGANILSSVRTIHATYHYNNPPHDIGGEITSNDATGPWLYATSADRAFAYMTSYIDESFVYFQMHAFSGGGPEEFGVAFCRLTTNFVLTDAVFTGLELTGEGGGFDLTRTAPTPMTWHVDNLHWFHDVLLTPGSYTLDTHECTGGEATIFIPAPGAASVLALAAGLGLRRSRRA